MNNRVRIILAVVFIAAGTAIQLISKRTDIGMDPDLMPWFTGMLYGAGFVLIIQMRKRRKDQEQKEQK